MELEIQKEKKTPRHAMLNRIKDKRDWVRWLDYPADL